MPIDNNKIVSFPLSCFTGEMAKHMLKDNHIQLCILLVFGFRVAALPGNLINGMFQCYVACVYIMCIFFLYFSNVSWFFKFSSISALLCSNFICWFILPAHSRFDPL